MFARILQAVIRGGTIRLSQRRSTTVIEVTFVGIHTSLNKPKSSPQHQNHHWIAMQLQRIVRGKQGRDKARAQAEVVATAKAESLDISSRFTLFNTKSRTHAKV